MVIHMAHFLVIPVQNDSISSADELVLLAIDQKVPCKTGHKIGSRCLRVQAEFATKYKSFELTTTNASCAINLLL